ncbi:hypothetical protein Acr_00g0056650 [Actinidia rufa]|uniref:Uncharacterized protein n=1 Tax=Actinidia rufa TaxID=165716 RepID=A0A7J0DP89_9ERIC|nr:hypothetical protein Acr_00g0056650 [Actinidia rufa]
MATAEDFTFPQPPVLSRTSSRKSFSYVERDCEDDGEEEKMDMLWEDFNEELSKIQGPRMQFSDLPETGFRCGAVVSGKKPPSVAVFVKVMKKVFLFYNSHHRTVKKPSR